MSGLRLLGVFVAVLSLFFFYGIYRRRGGKTPIFLGIFFSVSLLTVALYPTVLDGIIRFFTEPGRQYFRLMFLLILSVVVLAVLVIRTFFVTDHHERSLRDLVFQLGLRQFERDFSSSDIRNLQVIIPAFNEEENLRRLLPRLPDHVKGRELGVLVISDGSRDRTPEVAREHSHLAVENLLNLGQGAALKLGFEICRRHGAEVVVTMDADGQHDPDELEKLVAPILDGEADLTVGSRQLGEARSGTWLRRVGIGLINRILSWLLWRRITDCSNGYRAVRTLVLDHLEYSEPNYVEPQFLIQALAAGYRYREVPVTIASRWGGKSKKPADLRYGLGFLGAIVRSWWRS